MIIGTESNHYITEKGLDRTLSRSKPADAWFYSFLDSNQPRTLNIDNDGATGELALFIDLKVEQAGKVVGVAGLGLSMKELSELIHNFSFGERGKVYLVRSDGLIQVHPEGQFSGRRTLAEQIGAAAAQAIIGQKTATNSSFTRGGEDYLALSLPLRDLDWTLVAEVPQSQIYAEARRALWISSGIGLAVALVSLLLVVLLARGLVRPIRQVTTALVQIGGGAGGTLADRMAGVNYGNVARRELGAFLSRDDEVRRAGDYRVSVALWLNPDGSVARWQLLGSTGQPQADEALKKALSRFKGFRAAPPANLNWPMRLQLTNRMTG